MIQFILYASYIVIFSTILYILNIFYNYVNLDNKLKKYNIILICDIEDYSIKIYKFIKLLKMNVFDINDDVSIINHLIQNSDTQILLDTNGGYISSNDKLVNYIINSELKLITYILRKAYSAGTVIALSSYNLHMDKNACLSGTDPQITILKDTISVKSLIKMCEEKEKNNISDLYLIQYYESIRLYSENIDLITKLLNKKFRSYISKEDQNLLIERLTSGNVSHHLPISYDEINEYIILLNIPFHVKEIYNLYFDLFFI